MSDQNPYRPPSEYDEPIAPTSDGSWPKTATATIDADWYLRALHVDKRREKLFVRVLFEPDVADALRACLRSHVPG